MHEMGYVLHGATTPAHQDQQESPGDSSPQKLVPGYPLQSPPESNREIKILKVSQKQKPLLSQQSSPFHLTQKPHSNRQGD